MEFAVVRFTDENAPGIISTNWINRRKGTCWFPNVMSDMKKNKLLIKRRTPGNSWLECPIKVLKEFACYESAKTYMTEVEEISTSEVNASYKRKKTIYVSDEDSCSEEDETTPKKSKNYPAYKFHAPFFTEAPNTKLSQNQYQVTFSLPVPTPARNESMETPGYSRSDSEVSDNRTASSSQDYLSPNNDQGIMSDIEQLKIKQTNMSNTLAEILNTVKNLESKMDTLLANSRKQYSSAEPVYDVEDMDLISSMPLGMDDFIKLNEKIKESHTFKQYFRFFLKTCGGRELKSFVANIMRKMITDDVGEKYSLTGKQSLSGVTKQPFEKTSVYKLILEVSFATFSEAKDINVREAIGDWLTQAKFRKSRRGKRATSSQPTITFVQVIKDENSSSNCPE